MFKYIIIILFSFTYNYSSIVMDEYNNESLVGVKITSSIDTTYSNLNGSFNIKYKLINDTIRYELISYDKIKLNTKYKKIIKLNNN